MNRQPLPPMPLANRRAFLSVGAGLVSSALGRSADAAQLDREEKKKLLGITLFPEYIQSEGIDAVLDSLVERAHATAVTVSPYVMAEANREIGQREPPADADAGSIRLLDRPLWGKREVWVVTAPSFIPDKRLYSGLRYQPAEPNELSRREGPIVGAFIDAAKDRGLKVYLQVQAAIPPGYRVQFGGPVDDDLPRLPDGRVPPNRLDKNGSLASHHIRDYTQALLRDLLVHYPRIDGVRVDWPEYPPYFLDDFFLDFSEPARAAAQRFGFDFQRMRSDAASLYARLHGGLSDADLAAWIRPDGGRFELIRFLSDHPGIIDLIRFKSLLVEELIVGFRRTIDEVAGPDVELMPNAFPPPWTLASGMDFRKIAPLCSAISVKHYTMHWPMMIRFYADQLSKANPGISDALLIKCLVNTFEIADDSGFPSSAEYKYPEPETPHPVGSGAMARKIEQAQSQAGSTPILPLVHGYGPTADFERRLRVGWESGDHGIWINRYAYLRDDKLDVIGKLSST